MYVTEQLEELPLPLRVQLSELKEPKAVVIKLTTPVGVIAVPVPVSDDAAVHVTGALTGAEPGMQFTLVDVGRSWRTMNLAVAVSPKLSTATTW